MRGIVFIGTSQYDVLGLFLKEIIKGFEINGCEILTIDRANENYMDLLAQALTGEYEYDFIFDINGILMGHDRLYTFFKQKYVAFLVDHPMYHHKRLMRQHKPYYVTTIDKDHIDYLKKYYPHLDRIKFVPHGGIGQDRIEEYKNRKIDVLFLGSYENPKKKLEYTERIPNGMRELIVDTCKILETKTQWTMEQALLYQLEMRQLKMTNSDMSEIMSDLVFIDEYIRAYYRDKVIRTLGENGVTVEVYGNGWEEFDGNQTDFIHIHESVSYMESLELMGQAKIVLNVMPWFKKGSHERVFTTMMNGALCMTDRSEYLEEVFTDKKELVFYDLKEVEKLPGLIQEYLNQNEKAKEIALAGKEKSEADHTWKKRGQELLDWIVEES
ncbi:glycosyltransferase family protein [Anaerosacchariphilus polymeriproducens]|uniref:Glycosyltransferase family 1 protein n=1 Tax=Anaerosacchariphilus polymeriproducens TaxID=1812858 RepID=A0A371AQT7_9FIRM|nr:glycosyltransferase [Anaerosacchariphilus polymeriproducens]RDU21892.1 glycosyltransferase family 1 protein [Anaerosacchariphilus polymeriproducens]